MLANADTPKDHSSAGKRRTSTVESADAAKKKKIHADSRSGSSLKICCWNVAGFRSFVKKAQWPGDWPNAYDIVFLSEIKTKELDTGDMFNGFVSTIAPASVKGGGYSGVALFSKVKPQTIDIGLGDEELDQEGRIITAEYESFYFVGAYVPNIGQGFNNKVKRQKWEEELLIKVRQLDQKKPVVYCGDLNVAHNEIDLARPKENYNKTPGFSQDERDWFSKLLNEGCFKDTFRELYPKRQEFTFWSYRGGARAKNIGWRLDYVLVSERIMEKVVDSGVVDGTSGSDHAPIFATIWL